MKLKVLPQNISIETDGARSVHELMVQHGILIENACGGTGKCGKCKVKVLNGLFNQPDESEINVLDKNDFKNGVRLACRLFVQGDSIIQTSKIDKENNWNHRLIELPMWFKTSVPNFQRPFQYLSDDDYGLSFDIGTTSIVCMLWHYHSGELVDKISILNPQSIYGADVLSRIYMVQQDHNNLELLQKSLLKGINDLVEDLLSKQGICHDQVVAATFVGNTTMSHLLMGINPESLAKVPFKPVFTEAKTLQANGFELNINPLGTIYIMPNIAGHVGSDLTAGIIATKIYERKGLNVLIDVGTNGEIILEDNGKLFACSTAAGPAFEGACITHGMRAEKGAIQSAAMHDGDLRVETVGELPAVGICGSGLIDVIANLLACGAIDYKGKIFDISKKQSDTIPPKIYKRIIQKDKSRAIILVHGKDTLSGEDILLTQADIRQVQMAKGAIAAGVECLLSQNQKSLTDVNELLIAGAFGNYINIENAMRIGLFALPEKTNIKAVGNTAGIGASMALLSEEVKNFAESIVKDIDHVELSMMEDFQMAYISNLNFPKTGDLK